MCSITLGAGSQQQHSCGSAFQWAVAMAFLHLNCFATSMYMAAAIQTKVLCPSSRPQDSWVLFAGIWGQGPEGSGQLVAACCSHSVDYLYTYLPAVVVHGASVVVDWARAGSCSYDHNVPQVNRPLNHACQQLNCHGSDTATHNAATSVCKPCIHALPLFRSCGILRLSAPRQVV